MKLVSQQLVVPARPRALMWASSAYSRATGPQMIRQVTALTRSDTIDSCERFLSPDNGKTWEYIDSIQTHRDHPQGKLRLHHRGGWVDARTDRYLAFRTQGILPTDDPLEGMRRWGIHYAVSHDGGRTFVSDRQVMQPGGTPERPIDGVHIGHNSMMIGDFTCVPISDPAGRILHPCQIAPQGPDGNYYNPAGSYTWHEAAVLIGTWRDATTLDWEVSQRVRIDPTRSTRGLIEPTIAFLPDGRLLMVMRGSNDRLPSAPGHKWFAISADGGRSFGPAAPWTYTDGKAFFSPSSCSQLLPHSSGRLFWLGNITPENPAGNLPRRPMVIAQVDPASGLLQAQTTLVVDDRKPGDSDRAWFSNFCAYEDRFSGEVVVNMSRTFCLSDKEWTSGAYEYRIDVRG